MKSGLILNLLIVTIAVTSSAGENIFFKTGEFNINELKSSEQFAQPQSSQLNGKPTRYFVIQFKSTITVADQQQLRSLGAEVLRYLPDDSYVVRVDENVLREFKSLNSNVLDFAPYHPNLRVSEELRLRSIFNSVVYKNVRLQFFSGVHVETLVLQLMNEGFDILESSDSTLVVRAQVKDFERLSHIEGVEWMTQMPRMRLRHFVMPKSFDDSANYENTNPQAPVGNLADLSGYESGIRLMNFEPAWQAGYRGQGQLVGVADTGLDTGDSATLSADFSNYQSGFALGYGSRSWADYMGHGTHVMGSVVSVGANSNGKVTGGAIESKLVAQSLWSVRYNTLAVPSDLKIIFNQAYQAGVRVHSNSWGDSDAKGVYNAETSQVDQFVWDNPEMVILFAAGNDGVDADADGRIDAGSVSAPATSKNILSVGASENLVHKGGIQTKLGVIKIGDTKPWAAEPIASDTLSNNPNGLAAFSSRGPTLDKRIKPDIVAPGTNILSDCSQMQGADELWGRFDANYCFSGGTSMSTPLVAAAAALVRQKLIDLNRANPSAALVKGVMLHTATDLYPGQYGELGQGRGQEILNRGPNSDQGYGRVDVAKALGGSFQFFDEKAGLATGETESFQVQGSLAKVTLVYTDAPGAPEAKKALVNNLDIEVHAGDKLISASASLVDNIEQIVFERPVVNPTILVKGTNIAMGHKGKQPYAIVWSAELAFQNSNADF